MGTMIGLIKYSSSPRDHHQIWNLKHSAKKKDRLDAIGNVADELLEVMWMDNRVDFVKETIYTQGKNKPPSFIYYTTEQMKDMQQFLKSDPDHI